jgi:hypothetical protein
MAPGSEDPPDAVRVFRRLLRATGRRTAAGLIATSETCERKQSARIRSRPSSAGSTESAAARAQDLFIVPIALAHASCPTVRSDDMPRAAWVLTAPLLTPIVEAI